MEVIHRHPHIAPSQAQRLLVQLRELAQQAKKGAAQG